jgi:hypothetical protein
MACCETFPIQLDELPRYEPLYDIYRRCQFQLDKCINIMYKPCFWILWFEVDYSNEILRTSKPKVPKSLADSRLRCASNASGCESGSGSHRPECERWNLHVYLYRQLQSYMTYIYIYIYYTKNLHHCYRVLTNHIHEGYAWWFHDILNFPHPLTCFKMDTSGQLAMDLFLGPLL